MENKLGTLIESYARNQGMSLNAFAKKCGISRGYISALRNGVNPANDQQLDPSLTIMKKLAEGMGMSLARLLYLSGYTEEEGVGIGGDDFPEELRKIMLEVGLDYLLITKEAYEKGITPEMLKSIVETVTKWREK